MTEEVYIAIRVDKIDEDKEWADLSTTAYDHEACSLKANESSSGKVWRQTNPVVRISKFKLTETK